MHLDIQEELTLHFKSGYPLVFVLTQEERRAQTIVDEAVLATGMETVYPFEGRRRLTLDEIDHQDSSQKILVLDDVHRRLNRPDVVRKLADMALRAPRKFHGVVIIAPWIDIPPELERHSAILELPLPSPVMLRDILDETCESISISLTEDVASRLVRVAQGLTADEADRAFSKAILAWPENSNNALQEVMSDKRRALRRSQVLESVQTSTALDDVGGLDRLKGWLKSRANAYTKEAREFGLPTPRGLLLMGIQGCGKSLTAKAVAGYWNLPLVRLDLSAVFGSERPEQALRSALKVAEAMSPVVLWIDEIEKGFDKNGEGTASRLLGGMVTWLQENQSEVFVIATANRVEALPPELPRKGRFDEIFFVDLPNIQERCDILTLHLRKRGRIPEEFSIEALAKKADKLTGSELEQLIIAAMYTAFARGGKLTDADLILNLKETVPLYDTFEDEIKNLKEWARKRARPASTDRRKVDLFAENR